jgi:hypothetical protein
VDWQAGWAPDAPAGDPQGRRRHCCDNDRTGHRKSSAGCRTAPGYGAPASDDCSTSRIISSFSATAYLRYRTPHPPTRFF